MEKLDINSSQLTSPESHLNSVHSVKVNVKLDIEETDVPRAMRRENSENKILFVNSM